MTAVVVAVLLLATAAAAGVPIVRWWLGRRVSARELPPIVLPFRGAGDGSVEPTPIFAPRPKEQPVPVAVQPPVPQAAQPPLRADWIIPIGTRRPLDVEAALPVSNETIRFRRPVDEPVQLLPGRLEVIAGDPQHREIRFVRIPGEPCQLILGR